MCKILITVKYLLIAAMPIMFIAGAAGWFLSSPFIYTCGIILFCLLATINCYSILCQKGTQSVCGKQEKVIAVLSFLVIAATESTTVFCLCLIMLSLVIFKYNRNRRLIMIVSAFLAAVMMMNQFGLILSDNNGKPAIAKRGPEIYCDTSPNGKIALTMTITKCESSVSVDYYLQEKCFLLTKKSLLLRKGALQDEHFFLDDKTVIIGEDKIVIFQKPAKDFNSRKNL